GQSGFHCPYCDAWEWRDRKLGVYARNKNEFELAMALKTWSSDVSLFTDGKNYLSDREKKSLRESGTKLFTDRVLRLDGKKGKMKRIIYRDGTSQPLDALFFSNGYQ